MQSMTIEELCLFVEPTSLAKATGHGRLEFARGAPDPKWIGFLNRVCVSADAGHIESPGTGPEWVLTKKGREFLTEQGIAIA
jgi:hypothetical protein